MGKRAESDSRFAINDVASLLSTEGPLSSPRNPSFLARSQDSGTFNGSVERWDFAPAAAAGSTSARPANPCDAGCVPQQNGAAAAAAAAAQAWRGAAFPERERQPPSAPPCVRGERGQFTSYDFLKRHAAERHAAERRAAEARRLAVEGHAPEGHAAAPEGHEAERPYRCHVCGLTFKRLAHVQRHQHTHTGEKPHRCAACGRAFALFSTLKLHRRTHTGERPYRCDVCGQTFSHHYSFKRHQRTHARVGDELARRRTIAGAASASGLQRRWPERGLAGLPNGRRHPNALAPFQAARHRTRPAAGGAEALAGRCALRLARVDSAERHRARLRGVRAVVHEARLPGEAHGQAPGGEALGGASRGGGDQWRRRRRRGAWPPLCAAAAAVVVVARVRQPRAAAHGREAVRLQRVRARLHALVYAEAARAEAHGREAPPLRLVRARLPAGGAAADPPAHSHGREAVLLRGVRAGLRPPPQLQAPPAQARNRAESHWGFVIERVTSLQDAKAQRRACAQRPGTVAPPSPPPPPPQKRSKPGSVKIKCEAKDWTTATIDASATAATTTTSSTAAATTISTAATTASNTSRAAATPATIASAATAAAATTVATRADKRAPWQVGKEREDFAPQRKRQQQQQPQPRTIRLIPYKCNVCGQMFLKQLHLRKHLQKHDAERPNRCDLCGSAFRYLSDLMCHWQTHVPQAL
ncbi:uncharacterized protein LOC142925137 [Petromyzon marinus]|uniref:uncharacterized protein LOC142925137 n=1 Tax=Petromyzon marinus TaxID=7757 RepID=UPI003F71C6E2